MSALLLSLLLSCHEKIDGEMIFVRDGLIAPGQASGAQALAGGKSLIARPWSPGERLEVAGQELVAPQQAECVPLFSVDLGDVSRLIAQGGSPPDTSLAWSPDGRWLAVGSYLGELLVVDGWTGEIRARHRLAETLVKRVVWSADGELLYAVEQSPDAWLRALSPGDLSERWKLRLADVVGSSSPPSGQDIYGVYALPTAFGLTALPGGELLLAATHGWAEADGRRLNRAQVLRVGPEGQIRARWPAEPADATFLHLRTDGITVAVAISRSADGPPPPGLPVGGVQLLSLDGLAPLDSRRLEPLAPWYQSVFLWEALDISDRRVLIGAGDGRLRVFGAEGEALLSVDAGTPVLAGEVPISASIGFGRFGPDQVLFLTSRTAIPWGAAAPELRPPMAHPNENALWSYGLDGQRRWTWTGEHRLEGIEQSPDGDELVVAAGPRETDQRRDLYGALVFDLDAPQGSGAERLRALCATEGPTFFRPALSADGRVAVAEHPFPDGAGGVAGAYRVTVLR